MMYEKECENPNYKFMSYDVDNLNWHIHYHESFERCFVTDGERNSIKEIKDFRKYFNPENVCSQKELQYLMLGFLAENTSFKEAAASEESQLSLKIMRYIEKNYQTACLLQSAADELSYG